MTEHGELLVLRALAERQQQELAWKDQTIEAQKAQIEKQRIQIEDMIQALLHARKKLFGPSAEVSKHVDGQLSLFDAAQKLAEELAKEQRKITVPTHTRRARQPGVRAEMPSGLVQEIEEYIIPEADTCGKCGCRLEIAGKRIVRTEVEFAPVKLKVEQIVQQAAKCTRCGTGESEYDSCHFQKASVPAPPSAHSISTLSLTAHVMHQKFVMGMLFARQEKDWYRLGLVLSRADMASWSIRCCKEWLLPIYNRIHEQLLKCQAMHMDETRIQCNKEEERKEGSESFVWVMRSAECEEVTAAYFYCSRSRSGEAAGQLLSGFDGFLITDAYSGYGTVENIMSILCWAHCHYRITYVKQISNPMQQKDGPGSLQICREEPGQMRSCIRCQMNADWNINIKSASKIDVIIVTDFLPSYTTSCFEALTKGHSLEKLFKKQECDFVAEQETLFERLVWESNITVEEMRERIAARIERGWNDPDPKKRAQWRKIPCKGNMDYISVKELAEKWKLSEQWIQKLCEDGRIDGVQRFGRSWMIPKKVEKPDNLQKRRPFRKIKMHSKKEGGD